MEKRALTPFSQYAYDDLYRLTTETITDPVNGNYSAAYSYDAVGNRILSVIDGVTTAYSYDANDRLTQQGGVTYSYDDQGNTLTETEDGIVIKAYSYNSQQEVVQVVTDDGTTQSTTTFRYGPDGIRTGKATDGAATDYTVDYNRDYAQVLREEAGSESVIYTYGDDLVSQERTLTSESSFFMYDGLGSTRALTDALGAISDEYDYEAFGELLNSNGATENNYLYTGEQFDYSLNQYYLRARYYDQGVGRFTQMDTWMGNNQDPITLHKYLYANADPANGIDPSGMFTAVQFGVASAGTVALALATLPDYGAIGKSLAGLFSAGIVLDDPQESDLEKLVQAQVALTQARVRAEARVQSRARGRDVLFHYTSRLAALLIGATGEGFTSARFQKRSGAIAPAGFYATDISPWDTTYSQADLSALFFGGNRQRNVGWFVAVDGSEFNQVYNIPREYVREGPYPGIVPVDVITIGPNLMLPGVR